MLEAFGIVMMWGFRKSRKGFRITDSSATSEECSSHKKIYPGWMIARGPGRALLLL